MQTLSGMRRNSSNTDYIRLLFLILFFGVLQILSSSFVFFPTFAGVFFCYIVVNIENEENFIYVFLSFLYLGFYELNKGFYLFSSLIFFILFYEFFLERIRSSFTCKSCIIVLYVASYYFGMFFINTLIAYILNMEFPAFSMEYFYYIAFDFVISTILFRTKV